MRINFNFEFSLYSHLSATRIIIFPSLAAMIPILGKLFPLVSVIGSSYGKEHYYDSHHNLSTFDVMYDNKSQIFGKSYEGWTAQWWKWAYSIPINENSVYDDYGVNCNNSPIWPRLVFF